VQSGGRTTEIEDINNQEALCTALHTKFCITTPYSTLTLCAHLGFHFFHHIVQVRKSLFLLLWAPHNHVHFNCACCCWLICMHVIVPDPELVCVCSGSHTQ
jgi:hypothetical protein